MLTHRGGAEKEQYRAGTCAKHGQTKDPHKPHCPAWKELIRGKRGGVVALTYVRAWHGACDDTGAGKHKENTP